MKKEELISIGELAKACHVSPKTLRHYAKLGILEPAYIDPESSYRYYRKEQLIWLVMIKRLKLRDFSLAEIQEFLNTRDISDIKNLYKAKAKAIDEEISRLEQAKDLLEKKAELFESIPRFDGKKDEHLQVEIKKISERPIVFVQEKNGFTLDHIAEAMSRLQSTREKYGLPVSGECCMSLFYHDYAKTLNNTTDYEMASVLSRLPNEDCPFVKTLPAGLYATVVHQGSREGSIEAYEYLKSWTLKNGYQAQGPTIKVYLLSYAHTKSRDQIVSEFQVLVEK